MTTTATSIICDVEPTREKTPEGFLKVRIRATRTGVMRYKVSDVTGVEDLHGTGYVHIARKPEDVFDKKSLSTLRSCSITDRHPKERKVDSNNYKRETVGHVIGDAEHDDNAVYVPAIIKDSTTVDVVENERDQASIGGEGEVVPESGEMDGQSYDYKFRNIKYNHIAIAERGRAGNARILDEDTDMPTLEEENKALKAENTSLKTRLDRVERDSVINDAKTINPDFKPDPNHTAKQMKVALINDSLVTDASSDELVDFAYNNLKKAPSHQPPVIELSNETTRSGITDAEEDEQPQYNQWEN